MRHVFFSRLLLGPFWFAVEVAPITIAVTLLRVNAIYAVITLAAYLIVMNVVELSFEAWRLSLLFAMITTPVNLMLQIPVWGLTWLAIRGARSLGGPK